MSLLESEFKNRLGAFVIPSMDPELVRKARLTICETAQNVADASMIMSMLGIMEADV